jgi:hypothetical protein
MNDLVSLELQFPRNLTADDVTAYLRSLWGLPRGVRLSFEVGATHEGITHHLVLPSRFTEAVVAHARATMPGVRLSISKLPELGEFQAACEWLPPSRLAMLRVRDSVAVSSSLLAALATVKESEALYLQWVLTPAAQPGVPVPTQTRPAPRSITQQLLQPLTSRPQVTREHIAAAREKTAEPLFVVVGRVVARADTPRRAAMLSSHITGTVRGLRTQQAWSRNRMLSVAAIRRGLELRRLPRFARRGLLNTRELAALIAWPLEGPQIPGLSLGAARQLLPSSAIPTEGRVIGRSHFPGVDRRVAISPSSSLRHLHVIGPTGVGKSTLLLNLIVGDLSRGAGVVVVDPKGDLISDVLECLPADRLDDVVLLDPTDLQRPVGLNPLSGADHAPDLVVDQIVGLFRSLYTSFWGPRTDDILRAALLTLVREPGMTLAEIPLLLSDESFRRRLVGGIDDPIALGPFWAWYENLSPAERSQATGPVLNKLRAFLLRRPILGVIGQAEPALDLGRLVSERGVLLVSLAKGLLGEEAASLLGSLVVVRLWQAVQARAALPVSQRQPFFAFFDEFQDYVALPLSMADVLAQARGFGLGVTLAHQHLAQLPGSLRQAVLANARSRVVFQTAASDARLLARELAPHVEAADLQGLGAHEVIAVVALDDGSVAAPATVITPPPPALTGQAAAARAASRERYGRAWSEIDRALRARHGERPGEGPVGARRRRS